MRSGDLDLRSPDAVPVRADSGRNIAEKEDFVHVIVLVLVPCPFPPYLDFWCRLLCLVHSANIELLW